MYFSLRFLKTHTYTIPIYTDIISNNDETKTFFRLHLSDGPALVRRDGLATGELGVGVGGPRDLVVGVVGDGERREAVAGAELAAPAGGHGEGAEIRGDGEVSLAGRGALDDVLDWRDGRARVRVDPERPRAAGVRLVADALESGDGPVGNGNWGSKDGAGREDGSEGGGAELHGDRRCGGDAGSRLIVGRK